MCLIVVHLYSSEIRRANGEIVTVSQNMVTPIAARLSPELGWDGKIRADFGCRFFSGSLENLLSSTWCTHWTIKGTWTMKSGREFDYGHIWFGSDKRILSHDNNDKYTNKQSSAAYHSVHMEIDKIG